MVNNCFKCSVFVQEKELDLSHDIPRWMGGKDIDGRHYLCHKCHKEYELLILKECIKLIPDFPLLYGKNKEFDKIFWNELTNQPEEIKKEFRLIALNIKREFYGDTKQITTERD